MIDHLQYGRGSRWAARLAGLMLLGGVLLAAGSACANPLDFTYSAYRLSGQTAAPLQQGEFVRSGEKLAIKIRYVNQTNSPAPAGAIILTLPSGCAFVRSDDARRLEVSFDGGRQFSPLSRFQARRGEDVRAVKSDDLTYIRMTFDRPVAPGENGEISIIATQQ